MARRMKNNETLRFSLGPMYTHCHTACCFKERRAAIYPWRNLILKIFHRNLKQSSVFWLLRILVLLLCQMFLPLSLTSLICILFQVISSFFQELLEDGSFSPKMQGAARYHYRGVYSFILLSVSQSAVDNHCIRSTLKQILAPHSRPDM